MTQKIFQLAADQIKPVAMGYGSCLATDRITIDGSAVGYCYREEPDTPEDSGWRFFGGDESKEYTDDPNNLALYDVDTIANYDPDITALLEAPAGSMFERLAGSFRLPQVRPNNSFKPNPLRLFVEMCCCWPSFHSRFARCGSA